MQAEIKDAYWAIFDTGDLTTPPGPDLVEIIDARIDAFAAKYQTLYPAAVKILLTDHEGLRPPRSAWVCRHIASAAPSS